MNIPVTCIVEAELSRLQAEVLSDGYTTDTCALGAGTKAFKFGMDRIYKPFYNNLMISNKGVSG